MADAVNRRSIHDRKRDVVIFVLNTVLVVMELFSIYMSSVNHGLSMLRFYTEDSNIFALIICILYLVFLFRRIKTGRMIPVWIIKAKYISVCCLFLTFMIVIIVLAPMTGAEGYALFMFAGSMLYHHTLCPLIAVISFIFAEGDGYVTLRDNLMALVPTVIYGITLVILNGKGIVKGPYPFLDVNSQTVLMTMGWILVIYGINYLLAFIVRWYKNRYEKKRNLLREFAITDKNKYKNGE